MFFRKYSSAPNILDLFRLALFFGGLFLIVIMTSCTNTDKTRSGLLKKTPSGSSMEQVIIYCQSQHLEFKRSDTAGYLNQENGKTVGKKSIWATLTESHTSSWTISTTVAYWGFDENGKLLDIWVWKVVDAP